MKAAVVGHVEWIEFARVERLPTAGEIAHAEEFWEEAAGGGGVASVQLAKLADQALLYTALGDDELGHLAKEHLEAQGVQMHADFRDLPQRRGFTFIDSDGERPTRRAPTSVATYGSTISASPTASMNGMTSTTRPPKPP